RHRYSRELALAPVLKHTPKHDAEVSEVIGEQIKSRRTKTCLVSAIQKLERRHDCVNGLKGSLSGNGFARHREGPLNAKRQFGFYPQGCRSQSRDAGRGRKKTIAQDGRAN